MNAREALADLVVAICALASEAWSVGNTEQVPDAVVVVAAAVQRASSMSQPERLGFLADVLDELIGRELLAVEPELAAVEPELVEPDEGIHFAAPWKVLRAALDEPSGGVALELDTLAGEVVTVTISAKDLESHPQAFTLGRGEAGISSFRPAWVSARAVAPLTGLVVPVELRVLHVGQGDGWTTMEHDEDSVAIDGDRDMRLITIQIRTPQLSRVSLMMIARLMLDAPGMTP